jgi:hypothetical protein
VQVGEGASTGRTVSLHMELTGPQSGHQAAVHIIMSQGLVNSLTRPLVGVSLDNTLSYLSRELTFINIPTAYLFIDMNHLRHAR